MNKLIKAQVFLTMLLTAVCFNASASYEGEDACIDNVYINYLSQSKIYDYSLKALNTVGNVTYFKYAVVATNGHRLNAGIYCLYNPSKRTSRITLIKKL